MNDISARKKSADQQRRPSKESVILSEYRLLNAIARRPELINDPNVSRDLLKDEVARSIFDALESLIKHQIEITPASLLQAGMSIDYNVSKQVVDAIFNIDEKGATDLTDILHYLHQEQTKMDLLAKLDAIRNKIAQPGDLDTQGVSQDLYAIDTQVLLGDKTSTLLNYGSWSDIYLEDLKQRKLGRKYSFGDPQLDEYFFKGAYPGAITIVAATPGQGKSTFVLHLIDNMIEHNQPCMYISLEMSGIDTMDRLISKRCMIPQNQLYDPDSIDDIVQSVEAQKEQLANRKNFYFVDDPSVSLLKLRNLIREFKQRTHNDYCFVAVDLLTQIKDFMQAGKAGGSIPASIEQSVNALNELAKAENCHILGVVQLNRETDNFAINNVDDIEKCRPTLNSIKNSSALGERARHVLVLFRPKYYAERYLPDDPSAQSMENILHCIVVKNSGGEVGKDFEYLFDGSHFNLMAKLDDDVLSNIQI